MSSKYELAQEQASKWKREFLDKPELVITLEQSDRKAGKEIQRLTEIMGDLHYKNEFLKKNL